MQKTIALIAAAFFFLFLQASAVPSFAAEWELWPKGRGEATENGEAEAAGKAGEKGGKKVSGGISAGTIGWTVGIIAGIAAIAVAAGGGGGGGSTSTPVHH
jgi:hypothetical protein